MLIESKLLVRIHKSIYIYHLLHSNRDRQRQLRKWQKQYGRQQQDRWKDRNNGKNRNASVTVKDSWNVLEEIDFPRLTKLKLSVKEPVDLLVQNIILNKLL